MGPSDKLFRILESMTGGERPLSGYSARDQFNPYEKDAGSAARNINAAFLLSLAGAEDIDEALLYPDSLREDPSWKDVLDFYSHGRECIMEEIESICRDDRDFRNALDSLYEHITGNAGNEPVSASVKRIRNFFFPEGDFDIDDPAADIAALRNKRLVRINRLNPQPLAYPAEELLLTANVLLTLPPESVSADDLYVPEELKEPLRRAGKGRQLYWYDHPIQVGSDPSSNEVVYGLKKLDEALDFEKEKGLMARDARLACVLSVSVTHEELHGVSRDYIEDLLRSNCTLKNLKIYMFTERDCRFLVENVLVPAAAAAGISTEPGLLSGILGVDGDYGRHYSFLKAIAAFWQVFVDGRVRATFKIDLDQVFPQKALLEQTGATAFGHFMSPLWGRLR